MRVADFSAVTQGDIEQGRNVLETPYGPVAITSPCGYAVLEPQGDTQGIATLEGQTVAVRSADGRFTWYGLTLSAGFGDVGQPDLVRGLTREAGCNAAGGRGGRPGGPDRAAVTAGRLAGVRVQPGADTGRGAGCGRAGGLPARATCWQGSTRESRTTRSTWRLRPGKWPWFIARRAEGEQARAVRWTRGMPPGEGLDVSTLDLSSYGEDVLRTSPDYVAYVPRGGAANDWTNQHFLVVRSWSGAFLAVWTQATFENNADQRVVFARSDDGGATWSRPTVVDGPSGDDGRLASWGFPVLAPGLAACVRVLYEEHRRGGRAGGHDGAAGVQVLGRRGRDLERAAEPADGTLGDQPNGTPARRRTGFATRRRS